MKKISLERHSINESNIKINLKTNHVLSPIKKKNSNFNINNNINNSEIKKNKSLNLFNNNNQNQNPKKIYKKIKKNMD